MNELDDMMSNILSTSPAVVDQNAKRPIQQPEVVPSPEVTELPAENIRRRDPLRVEQVNPLDDSALIKNDSIFKSDGQGNLYGVQGARRPLDGSRGDPFFLDPVERYQEVAPFDLYLPSLGKLAKLNTNQPDKAAWGLVRAEGRLPEYDYLGYYRMREGPMETRTGNFFKNIGAGLTDIATVPGRLASFMYETGYNQAYSDANDLATKKENAKNMLQNNGDNLGAVTKALYESAANDPIIAPHVKNIKDFWERTYGDINEFWGLDPRLGQTFGTQLWGGAGNALASIAALYLAPLPAPVTISLMNAGLSAPNIYYGSLERAGTTPGVALARTAAGTAIISAADVIPLLGTSVMRGVKRSAIGEILGKFRATKATNPNMTVSQFINHYSRMNALKKTPLRMAGETGTETFQGVVEDYLSGALQSREDWENSIDRRLIEAFGAGMAMVATAIPEYRNAPREMQMQLLADFTKSGAFVGIQNRMVEMLKPAIDDGVLTVDDAKALAVLAASPAAHEFVNDRIQMALEGAMDKATPEDIEDFRQRAIKMKENGQIVTSETLNAIDQNVAEAVRKGGFSDADVPLFQALFRGLAAIKAYSQQQALTYADIGEFFSLDRLPKRGRNTIVGEYDQETNTLRIQKSQRPGGKSAFDTLVVGDVAAAPSDLAERTKTILHEMSHKIDKLTGQVGLGSFLADAFEAISVVFGEENAAAVKAGKSGRKTSAVNDTAFNKKYTKFSNTTEWKAQAIERLGKAAAKYLGLSGSKAQQFLTYLNLFTRGAEDVGLATKGIVEYNKMMSDHIKENSQTFIDILNAYGQTQLANKIKEFVNGDYTSPEDVGLSYEDAKNIAQALKGFMDDAGIAAVKSVMDLDTMQSFIEKTNGLFEQGIESTNEESERLAGADPQLYSEDLNKPSEDGTPVSPQELVGGREELLTDDELLGRYIEGEQRPKKWLMPDMKIGDMPENVQKAITNLVEKNFVYSDGLFYNKAFEAFGISDLSDLKGLTGDELIEFLNMANEGVAAETRRLLANYNLTYFGSNTLLEDEPEYRSVDILDSEPLMPKADEKTPTSTVKPETFTEWYQNNNVEQISQNTQTTIKNTNGKKIRFPKLAKWWGRLIAGDTLLTMDWLGGRALLDQFGILDAERKWNNIRFAVQEQTQNVADKEMGFNAITREEFYNRMATGYIDVVESNGEKRTLTGFEMMDVYLSDQQPYSKQRMALAFQGGQAAVDEVIKAMTPEMKQYAEILRSELAKLRTLYEEALGIKFQEWENYWPVSDKYGQIMSKNRIYSYFARNTEAQGQLSIRDAREKFNQYVNKYALAKSGYYKQVQLLKSVFTGVPDRIRRIAPQENHLFNKFNQEKYMNNMLLQDALGENGARRFLEGIESLLKAPAADLPIFTQGVIGKAINAATISRLVWTPISLAKNAVNIFLGAAADPDGAASYWQGLGAALSNPAEAWKFMMQFPTIRNRFKGITVDEFLQATNVSPGLLVEVGNTISGGKASASKILASLSGIFKVANKAGMSFMLAGDAIANVFGLYGYAQKLMSQTNGDIDMVDSALNEFIANTQSTTLRSVKSNFHRTMLSMPIVGNLGALSAEGVIKMKNIGQTIAQAIVGEKTFGEASRKVLPIVLSTIAFIMLSVGIGDLWDDDEDNDKDVYDGLVNQSLQELMAFNVLGNNVLSPLVGNLFGVRNQGINTPFTSEIAKLFTNLHKGNLYDASLQTATMFGGLYLDRFANTISGGVQAARAETQQEFDVGVRRAIGRTKAFAERREGVKKEKK